MNRESDHANAALPVSNRNIWAWFDPRNRSMGMLAFVLNRITAIGLVFYLTLHLVVLSLLAFGESTWDMFIEIVRSPVFLILDVVLIAGVLIHGLNGIRLTLVGMGIAANQQKALFIILMILTVVILILAASAIFTI